MKKKELLKFLKTKAKQGYITHPFIVENLFNETEDIGKEYLSLLLQKPKPRCQTFLTGMKGMRIFEQYYLP